MHLSRIRENAYLIRVHHRERIPVVRMDRIMILIIGAPVYDLRIAESVHHEDDLFLLDFFLLDHDLPGVFNRRLPRGSVLLPDRLQLGNNDLRHRTVIIEKLSVLLNAGKRLVVLRYERLEFESDQPDKTHIEDRLRLLLRESEPGSHLLALLCLKSDPLCDPARQTQLRHLLVPGSPEDLDDQIDHIDGFYEAFLDLLFQQILFEKASVLSVGELKAEFRERFENPAKRHRLGTAVGDDQHIHAERILELGLFIKNVPYIFRIRALLQFDDDADSFLGRLIRDVRDIRDHPVLREAGDVIQELADPAPDHGIGNLRDDDLLPAALDLLDGDTSSHS